MKTQAKIIEIRSKEMTAASGRKRWILKKVHTEGVWKHYCAYADEWTTVHIVRENKRGFTFSVYFAGKYTDHFVSRSDCDIVYEL